MTQHRNLPSWRSLLYVPANNERFVAKAGDRGADAVVLDLEDGVPPDEKAEARRMCREAIDRLAAAARCDVVVRVNAPLRLAVRDLEAVVRPGVRAIFVPKVETAGGLKAIAEIVSELEAEAGMEVGATGLVPMLETPGSLFEARAIAGASPRNVAMVLGSEDLATEAGFEPSAETLLHPKLQVAFAAKAEGLLALGLLDSVAAISEPEKTREVARRSARFGFDGATCVHPGIVPVLNEAFSPSEEQLDLARRTVEAMEAAWAEGRGAARLDGRMIDMPMLTRARALLRKAGRPPGRSDAPT
ncbi:HpcH/HpaI aldolase/citrate lyase family protein [Lutibaculum baratangense]|uniref:HpcH/HpaI aldolase/citrate lyase domain-containing protein n=1 Tax=Lutibaculum baratangense AMV1 TaxID=631454 RepID=V4TNX9_9HYPH|nr:CoA ester lyase [Lutibaculum baratangense]ESR27378.1 hypothetical protein N177_0132 [Lutibaculum baratangense AMV1]